MNTDDLAKHLSDPHWRLNNLYFIIDKNEGAKVLFRMNRAQEDLYRSMHNRNIVLKARQLGMSTFVCLFFLDQCLFNPNTAAGVVAHKLQAAEHIFKTKIKYPYEHLPDEVKAMVRTKDDSARMLTFSNDSSIEVDQSLRSGTKHLLLVSEYGHTCARDPDKAAEVRTGALKCYRPDEKQHRVYRKHGGRSVRAFLRLMRRGSNQRAPRRRFDVDGLSVALLRLALGR